MMQMNRKKRLLFDHLPKCGGMTVDKNLIEAYPSELVFTTSGSDPMHTVEIFKTLPQKDRWNFELISGHLTNKLIDYVHPNTRVITMFRHPIDRVVSLFKHATRDKSHYLYDFIKSNKLTIADFETFPTIEFKNWYVFHFSGWTKKEIDASPRESLEVAYENILTQYKVIGFQDNMELFLNFIEKEFELKLSFKELFENKSPKSELSLDLDEECKSNIVKANALDIELFDRLISLRKDGFISNQAI
jgi:hypothetical protein